MASNYMYKPIKSATKSRKNFVAHKSWIVTDENASLYNIQEYFGRFSNGSFSLGDINDSNVANEPITNGKYDRTVFNSIHHLYYADPENYNISGDPEYFKQQERNLHREVHVISIPSGITGDRMKENTVTMSNANVTIYDDGQDNLLDNSISSAPGFKPQSRNDYFVKVNFNDGWKFQKGNYTNDRTFKNGNIDIIDISDGPYEAKGVNVTFSYNNPGPTGGPWGFSGSAFVKTTGTSSLIPLKPYYETIPGQPTIFTKPVAGSFVRINNTQQLANQLQAYDSDFCVSLRVLLPTSQSVTSSFTGPYENPNGSGYRTLRAHDYNVLATSRMWSHKIPWELNVYNQNTALNGKIYFQRGTTGNTTMITSSALVNDNNWHSVVIQKSGSTMQMYVDGALQASKTDPVDGINVGTIHSDIHLGARKWGTQYRERIDIPREQLADDLEETQEQQYAHTRATNYIYPSRASFDQFRVMKKALTAAEALSLHTYYGKDNNIIGNVFYNHSMLTITDLSESYDALLQDYTLNFKGTQDIEVHNYRCVVENGDFNVSLNPTLRKNYNLNNMNLKGIASASFFNPYITTIGLYSEGNELLAVAKLAYPVKSPEELDIVFNVQFDT